jgi:hypothetical protein
MKICGSKLTTCRVSDGEVVELGFLDSSGETASVQLPFDQAESLVMTLPHLLARALRRRTGLENARYVFRVGDWSIEATEEEHDCLILTLVTVDGFEVSLAIPLGTCGLLGACLRDETEKAVGAAPSPDHAVERKN